MIEHSATVSNNRTSRRVASGLALTAAAVALGTGVATTVVAPAHAQTTYKVVTSASWKRLHVRSGPGTTFRIVEKLDRGTAVSIVCTEANGSRVNGPLGSSTIWDKIGTTPDGEERWVSDQYLNTGSDRPVAKPCSLAPAKPAQPTPKVDVSMTYLDGTKGLDEDGYDVNCSFQKGGWGGSCVIPSSQKIGTDIRPIPGGKIWKGKLPDEIPVGTMYRAIWGEGLLVKQDSARWLGRYCNWSVDFEYFDDAQASYRYDPGPVHKQCDTRAGRTITPNYDSAENASWSARGRFFKSGYTCAYLVENGQRKITSCTDLMP